VSEKFGAFGMSFASASVLTGREAQRAPHVLIAARDFIVPNVTICPTESLPYFCRTYSITSPRRSKQKSTSTSGIDTRSGLQEALEEQVELQRADVGDARGVGDERAAAEPRPAPRGCRDRAPP
jgi:hypothetical protein